jgi:pimeloyl-ACP methyl ester carboxylesterase
VNAADGTALAVRVRGDGPPLVLVNGITTSEFFWRHLLPGWTARHTVVTWDFKGHGESDPAATIEATTIEACADDLRRVLDAVGIERAPVVGFSMGSQVVLEAARTASDRLSAIVSLLGPAGRLFDTALAPFGPAIRAFLHRMPKPGIGPALRGLHASMFTPGVETLVRWLGFIGHVPPDDIAAFKAHFGRLHAPTVAAMALAAGEHDARDVLPTLDVPLLVIAGDRDRFAPSKTVGLPIAERARDVELVRIPGGTHTALFEMPEVIGAAIDDFLERRVTSQSR